MHPVGPFYLWPLGLGAQWDGTLSWKNVCTFTLLVFTHSMCALLSFSGGGHRAGWHHSDLVPALRPGRPLLVQRGAAHAQGLLGETTVSLI